MKTQDEQRQDRMARRMQTCVHFRGTQHDECEAGVNVRQLVGGPDLGWGCRIPCIPHFNHAKDAKKVPCGKFRAHTAEEVEAREREIEDSLNRLRKAIPAARADAENKGLRKGSGGRSEMSCPVCETGKLRYSVASRSRAVEAAGLLPRCP